MKEWLLQKRWRVILSGTLIVALPIVSLALFVYVEIGEHLNDLINKGNRLAVLNISTNIEGTIKADIRNGELLVAMMSLKRAVIQRDREEITSHLKDFVKHVSSIERAFVTDREGVALANFSEDLLLIGKSFADRDWYKGVSKKWEPYVSEFYLRAGRPQKHLFAIALPIRDVDNKVIGVLVLQAFENYIQEAISRITGPEKQKVYVVDKKGHLICHPDYHVDRIIDFTEFPSVRTVITGRSGLETLKNPDGTSMLTAYQPVKQWGWGVIVQRPEQEVYASLRHLSYALFTFTGIMIMIGALLGYRRSEALFSLKKLSGELEERVEKRTAELTKANRGLKMLSECNQTLVRTEDENILIEKLCRIITEHGGYRMALVGYALQDENRTVKAVAQAGYEDNFLDRFSLTWSDTKAGNGPLGTAMRTRNISIFRNVVSDEYPAEWREAALKRGYGSAIGLPLLTGEELIGALAIYSTDAFVFNEEEVDLLKELADDMAYGIVTIRSSKAHKMAEEALHRSQALYRSTLDNMMEGCQIIGPDWRYIYINNAAEKHNRRPREELLGNKYMDMWPGIEETKVFPLLRQCMEKRTAHLMENEFAFSDGVTRWFELSIQPVPDGIFILSIDITERKQAEEAFIARKAAEEASRAKSDFLANMSHELRTPLNSVIGFAEVLEDRLYGALNEKQHKYVSEILGSGRHLLQLINDILDLSKVEAGKLELNPCEFSLSDVLEGSLTMFKEKAMKHGIKLNAKIDPEVDITIEADERKFKQIMFNLLSNAMKFTPDGGYVGVSARRSEDFVEISVKDTGIGIKSEDLSKLFHEFTQLESAYTKNHEGTGLGLALTKKLVELHGGKIWVESKFGKGSSFVFVIPVKQELH